ncbi:MAG: nitrate reductase [Planctomycetota bacterium]|nr:MAG: nitrate reductase [Planctomycetota bacterium]
MSRKMNRREFIKILGGGVSTAALASLLPGRYLLPSQVLAKGEITKSPTYCEICFWKCAGWVYQKDGQAWKIIGNEIDQHSHGRMCTRGTSGIGAYLDENRLKTPLIRTQQRGKQVFKEASWEEALSYIAQKMEDIKKKYGPEAMALFSHGVGGKWFKQLMKAYGSYNITAPSYAQCRGPREEAFKLTFGQGLGSPENTDIENTDCLVLIGCHIGENLHNSQVYEFSKAQERRATIITVDPRFSVAASKSKYWLPIRPGTDMALLLSWIHVIIQKNLFDKDYVEKYALGFEALKKEVKPYTPEWAYPITGIEPDIIRKTAHEMAKNAPATLVHPSRHTTWYGDDTQRIRAVAILNALLGSWGRKGGFYFSQKAHVPEYPTPKPPKPKKGWRDFLPPGSYPFARSIPANVLRDLSIPQKGKEAPIKGWLVYATNLPHTLPEPQKTLEALQYLDLVVAIDILPTAITGWADVVLPECTYLERYDDLRIAPGREIQIALRAPAFPPKYNSKPSWWIAKKLAEKMDLGHYFPWKNIEEYLDYRLKKIGSSLAEMKRTGVKILPGKGSLYLDEKKNIRFKTPSGKIELYSKRLEEAGFDPIPKYTPPQQPPQGYYRLIYGRTPAHTFTRTINNPLLHEIMPENEVWIHPSVAKEWRIRHGQYIRLKNQDGVVSNRIKVKVTERIRPDAVFMAHGFGQTDAKLKRAYQKGASDSQLITKVKIDPIMGGTGMRVNFVTFERS